MSRALRHLVDDGFEHLGTVRIGTTLVVGDPGQLPLPPGSGAWHGAAVTPGAWELLGRPYEDDPDQLDELVLVHQDEIGRFYELYDEAGDVAAYLLPTARVAVLDGALRADPNLLREAAEADTDALPWVLDRGFVAAGVAQNPVRVYQPPGSSVALVSLALGPAPGVHATTHGFTMDKEEA